MKTANTGNANAVPYYSRDRPSIMAMKEPNIVNPGYRDALLMFPESWMSSVRRPVFGENLSLLSQRC